MNAAHVIEANEDTMGSKSQRPSAQPTTERLTRVEIDEKSWYEGIPKQSTA